MSQSIDIHSNNVSIPKKEKYFKLTLSGQVLIKFIKALRILNNFKSTVKLRLNEKSLAFNEVDPTKSCYLEFELLKENFDEFEINNEMEIPLEINNKKNANLNFLKILKLPKNKKTDLIIEYNSEDSISIKYENGTYILSHDDYDYIDKKVDEKTLDLSHKAYLNSSSLKNELNELKSYNFEAVLFRLNKKDSEMAIFSNKNACTKEKKDSVTKTISLEDQSIVSSDISSKLYNLNFLTRFIPIKDGYFQNNEILELCFGNYTPLLIKNEKSGIKFKYILAPSTLNDDEEDDELEEDFDDLDDDLDELEDLD
ncbi:MAG: hypothetical protein EAX96_06265 [Candidatus Lokiarchaeota archaeon]|nr:hypothetical protein [Candidatus Lokiarchaeota archaeon]